MWRLGMIVLLALVLLGGCVQQSVAPRASLPSTGMSVATPSSLANPTSSPPSLPSGPVVGDSFNGSAIDGSKWLEKNFNQGQSTLKNGSLVLSVDGKHSDSKAQVFTTSEWQDDFDVQVDFKAGTGWTDPLVSELPNSHLDLAAMGISLDDGHWAIINLTANAGAQEIMVYSSFPGQGLMARLRDNAVTGKLRIVRKGSDITFLHNSGPGWADLYTLPGLAHPVSVYLYAGSSETTHAFTTCFDNFVINSSAHAALPFINTAVLPESGLSHAGAAPSGPTPVLPFVELGNQGFMVDGQPFKFIGATNPNFGFYPGYGLNIEDAVTEAAQTGVKVLRIYLWFGNKPWAGTLEDMDTVIDAAARHGLYVIPVLTDLCPPRSNITKDEYFQILPHGNLASQSSLDSFESVIKTLITRKNLVNGRLYKDDSTIMAWQVANEPVLQYFDPTVIHNWLDRTTSYIKSIDSNHLVTIGTSAWAGDVFDRDKAYYSALDVPGLDFFSCHLYPPKGYTPPAPGSSDSYLDMIKSRTQILLSMGKPVVLDEFGYTSYRELVVNLGRSPNQMEMQKWLQVYKDQMDAAFSAGVSGAVFWGWGVPDTKLVPLWWNKEDHDITEGTFCGLIKNYAITPVVGK